MMGQPIDADVSTALHQRLRTLHRVSHSLSRAISFDELCRLTVELGRRELDFDRIAIFMLTDTPGIVRGTFGTDSAGNLRDERRWLLDYYDAAAQKALADNDHSLLIRNPHRLVDGHPDLNIVGEGWHVTALLWNGDRGIGWMVVDNLLRQRPLRDDDLEIISLFSTTVGHLAHLKRTEEMLRQREETSRQFQNKLKRLHEVTAELAAADSLDALCQQAIWLGRHHLDFDRLRLWFIREEDPTQLVGTYGIDEAGGLRDERYQSAPNNFSDLLVPVLSDSVLVSPHDEMPLYNHRAQVVGYGTLAAARVQDAQRTIGWLSVDNLLHRQPFSDYELELLALYANSIGHLAARQQAMAMVAQEHRLLRTILDAVPDEIFVRDTQGRCVLVNKQGLQAIPDAASEQDVLGRTVYEVFPPDIARHYGRDDELVLSLGTPIENEEIMGHKENGKPRFVVTIKTPLKNADDGIIGMVSVSRDVTAARESQQRALESAIYQTRIQLLYEVITNISHDFKTPLSIIHTNLYLMQRKPGEDHTPRLQLIKAQAELVERYIQQLLMISRLETSGVETWQPLNLNDLPVMLGVMFEQQARAQAVSLEWQTAPEPLMILGSAQELHQALAHVVQNALQFNVPGGRIAMTTHRQGTQAVLRVTDTGQGIAPEDLPRIFEPFYRADKARSTGGAGLGLAIARKVIELHGGRLTVRSELGAGSVFDAHLPLWDKD